MRGCNSCLLAVSVRLTVASSAELLSASPSQKKIDTSETPEGRSATFGLQGSVFFFFFFLSFLTSIAARFLVTFLQTKKSFFEPSREVPLAGLSLSLSLFYFFIFCFASFFTIFSYFFHFFIFHFPLYLSFLFIYFFFLKGSLNSGRSKVTRVAVGPDIHQPTNHSFRVCKVNPATLKVAITHKKKTRRTRKHIKAFSKMILP